MSGVTIQQAYAEACMALGEATVRERLMAKEIAALEALVPQEPPPTT